MHWYLCRVMKFDCSVMRDGTLLRKVVKMKSTFCCLLSLFEGFVWFVHAFLELWPVYVFHKSYVGDLFTTVTESANERGWSEAGLNQWERRCFTDEVSRAANVLKCITLQVRGVATLCDLFFGRSFLVEQLLVIWTWCTQSSAAVFYFIPCQMQSFMHGWGEYFVFVQSCLTLMGPGNCHDSKCGESRLSVFSIHKVILNHI